MAAPHLTPGSLGHLRTRAQVIVSTKRREFVYRWKMPRSPALRILIGPLFLATALVVFVLGVLVLALMLVAAVVAIVILAIAALLWSIQARLGSGRLLARRRGGPNDG